MGTTSSRSLRTKMVLVVLVATLGLVLVICFPLRAHILERFAAIERQLAADDLDAARNTIDAEIEAVGAMARDYGVWDETYAFVADDTQGPESEFVTSNFSDAMFTENRLELAVIARPDGAPRYETRFVGEGEPRATPVPIRELLPEGDDVLGARAASGIVRTSGGLFLVGTHAILTSAETGERRGTLLLVDRSRPSPWPSSRSACASRSRSSRSTARCPRICAPTSTSFAASRPAPITSRPSTTRGSPRTRSCVTCTARPSRCSVCSCRAPCTRRAVRTRTSSQPRWASRASRSASSCSCSSSARSCVA
ncbi:MAG: hypothetical protein J0L92_04435 [Deltaproteobacteria bacterium]|nr:hypothetical protein [Deltaproteobacteria bacterium]